MPISKPVFGPAPEVGTLTKMNQVVDYADQQDGLRYRAAGAYGAGTTFAKNDVVTDGGIKYASLQDANTGHTPASSPSWWEVWGSASTDAPQSANLVKAGPASGSAAAPTYRALVAADVPALTAAKISDFDTQVHTSRLDQLAAPTADVSANSQKVTNLAAPTTGGDATNKTYVDNIVTNLLDLKTGTDCSANPNYPAALKGDAYVVTVAGKVGGAAGKVVGVGDVYFAFADNAGGTEASVGASWDVLTHSLAGALLAANNLSDLANAATARGNLNAVTRGAATAAELTMATGKLLGRSTASTGAIEEITLGTGLSLSGGTLSATGAETTFEAAGYFPGKPGASEIIFAYNAKHAWTLPQSPQDIDLVLRPIVAGATSETVFSVQKNGTEVGTATFASGGPGDFAIWDIADDVTFNGYVDYLTLVAPATPDLTLAGLLITVTGVLS